MAITIGEGIIPVALDLNPQELARFATEAGKKFVDIGDQAGDAMGKEMVNSIRRSFGDIDNRGLKATDLNLFGDIKEVAKQQATESLNEMDKIIRAKKLTIQNAFNETFGVGTDVSSLTDVVRLSLTDVAKEYEEFSGLSTEVTRLSEEQWQELALTIGNAGLSVRATADSLATALSQGSFDVSLESLIGDPEALREFLGKISSREITAAADNFVKLADAGAKTSTSLKELTQTTPSTFFGGLLQQTRNMAESSQDMGSRIKDVAGDLLTLRTAAQDAGIPVAELIQRAASGDAEFKGMDNAIKGLGVEFDKFEKKAAGLRDEFGKIALAVGAAASAILGNELRKGIQENLQLASQFQGVFALIPDLSREAAQRIQQDAEDIGEEFSLIPQQVIPALQQALRLQIPEDSGLDFIKDIAPLASIGITDLGTAVSQVALVIRQFPGKELEDAANIANTFFQAYQQGVDVNRLGSELAQIAGPAQELGITFEELIALFAGMTQAGFSTAEAGTALSTAFLKLSEPSDDLKGILGDSSENMAELIDEAGGLIPFLQDLQALAEENGENFTSMALGGVRSGRALASIIDNGDGVAAILADITGNTEALNDGFEAFGEGPAQALLDFQLAAGEVRREFTDWSGTVIEAALVPAAEVLRNIADLEGPLGSTVKVITGLTVLGLPALLKGLTALAFNRKFVKPLQEGIQELVNLQRESLRAAGAIDDVAAASSEAGSATTKWAAAFGALAIGAGVITTILGSLKIVRDQIESFSATIDLSQVNVEGEIDVSGLVDALQSEGIKRFFEQDISPEALIDFQVALNRLGVSFDDFVRDLITGDVEAATAISNTSEAIDEQARQIGQRLGIEVENIEQLARAAGSTLDDIGATPFQEEQIRNLLAAKGALTDISGALELTGEKIQDLQRVELYESIIGNADEEIDRFASRVAGDFLRIENAAREAGIGIQQGFAIVAGVDEINQFATQLSDLRTLAEQVRNQVPSLFQDTFKDIDTVSSRKTLQIVQANQEGIKEFANGIESLQEAGFTILADIAAQAGPEAGTSVLRGFINSLEAGNTETLGAIEAAFLGVDQALLDELAALNESVLNTDVINFGDLVGEDFIDEFLTDVEGTVGVLAERVAEIDPDRRIQAGIAQRLEGEVRDAFIAATELARDELAAQEFEGLATAISEAFEAVTISVKIVPPEEGDVSEQFFTQELSGIVAGDALLEHMVTAPEAESFAALLFPEDFDAALASLIETGITGIVTPDLEGKAKTEMSGLGQNLRQGLKNGLGSGVSIGAAFAEEVNLGFAIANRLQSPSKVWEDFGVNLIEGLNKGLDGTRIHTPAPMPQGGSSGGSSMVGGDFNLTIQGGVRDDPEEHAARILGVLTTVSEFQNVGA